MADAQVRNVVRYRPAMRSTVIGRAVVLGLVLSCAVGPAAGAAPASGPAIVDLSAGATRLADEGTGQITVMARNLYLGADVGVALDLLPDMPAAAQFMWDQVAATDFDARVGLLAAEAAAAKPDVIGLQEATTWQCRAHPWSSATTVFDFTEQFLAATAEAGVPYVVAEKDGERALNPGYSIPAIPFLTTVNDPATFQPLFGSDSADCGFLIGDALLVRGDLAGSVLQVGTSEYEKRYAVVPVAFTIDRGYAWADVAVAGTTVRAVTTHLESLWDAGDVPPAAIQAGQLVDDLADTTLPLVVIGDFNSDPRDPRPAESEENLSGQPDASETCPVQPTDPTAQTADATCSAYWTMVTSGYTDSGPDAQLPVNRSWGADGDLAGPNPDRLRVALAQGNQAGFTDRLDYVFTRNGATPTSARIIGNEWPTGSDVWTCDDPSQVATTEESSAILAEAGLASPIVGHGVCLPTDHAGVVATVDVSAGPPGAVSDQAAPEDHSSFLRIDLLGWLLIVIGVLLVLLLLAIWGIYRLATRGRRRRRREEAAPSQAPGTADPSV